MREPRASRASQYRNRTYRKLLGSLAANVRRVRKSRGWSQQDAAEQCDMALQLFQRIESGQTNVTLTTLARLCDGLETAPSRLFASAPPPVPRPPGRPRGRA